MIWAYGGQFEVIPFSKIEKYKIYHNKDKKTMTQIKKELGCDYIQNAGFFVRKTFKPMNHLIVDDKILSNSLGKTGLSVEGNKAEFSYDNQVGFSDHVSGYPWLVLNGKLQTVFPRDIVGATKRSVVGKTKDSFVFGTFTTPIKLKELPSIMRKMGCVGAINLDGGGSVQRDWNGKVHTSSRIVHNFICIWLKKEDAEEKTKKEDGLKIVQDFIPKGNRNRPATKNSMKCITVHETGNYNQGSNAKSHAKYVSNTNTTTSWHYTVDKDGAYQHLPDNEVANHSGTVKGNRESISIEICVNSDGDFKVATKNAAALVRKLRKEHNIPLQNVVQHNYWNGKNCPANLRKNGWSDFLKLCEFDGEVEKPIATKTVVNVRANSVLNVRKNEPNSFGTNKSTVVGTYKKGQKVDVFEYKYGWWRTAVGWCSGLYLK